MIACPDNNMIDTLPDMMFSLHLIRNTIQKIREKLAFLALTTRHFRNRNIIMSGFSIFESIFSHVFQEKKSTARRNEQTKNWGGERKRDE